MKKYLIAAVLIAVLFMLLFFVWKLLPLQKKKSTSDPLGNVQAIFNLPAGIKPSDAQKTQLQNLRNKFGSRLEKAQLTVFNITTEEQRQARIKAANLAQKEGKKGKEMLDAINNAAPNTPEQNKRLSAAQLEFNQVTKEIRIEIAALMTPKQKEELKKLQQRKK